MEFGDGKQAKYVAIMIKETMYSPMDSKVIITKLWKQLWITRWVIHGASKRHRLWVRMENILNRQ